MATAITTVPLKAFRLLCAALTGVESAAVVVELAYLDPREPQAADRQAHVHDALRLLAMLRDEFVPAITLFPVVLVNDLPAARHCGEACHSSSHVTAPTYDRWSEAERADWSAELAEAGIGAESVRTFSMRNTRNRATKSIKRVSIKRTSLHCNANGTTAAHSPHNGPGIYQSHSNPLAADNFADVFADTGERQILLASQRLGAPAPMPRCGALMAQHYFDLYRHAAARCAGLTQLWIVDFNRASEGARTARGAEASFVLHPWPRGTSVHVANCVYHPTDPDRGLIQVTDGP
ncbi:MAG: hypothetical protein K8T25_17160 [Planctomycetia bacterium]|nr:hypothetical protein [Planctomycetia bacterium]